MVYSGGAVARTRKCKTAKKKHRPQNLSWSAQKAACSESQGQSRSPHQLHPASRQSLIPNRRLRRADSSFRWSPAVLKAAQESASRPKRACAGTCNKKQAMRHQKLRLSPLARKRDNAQTIIMIRFVCSSSTWYKGWEKDIKRWGTS